MTSKDNASTSELGPASLLRMGQQQTEAMRHMQQELLDAFGEANRAWIARMQSEADFWAELTSKLSTTKSMPEALETYQKSLTQRMQTATEDGRRMVEDCQKMMSKMTQSMSGGKLTGSS